MYNIDTWWDYPEDKQFQVLSVKQKCEKICEYMLDYKCSIRQASQELCIPKSTIHSYIHTYIKTYYDEEYMQIKTCFVIINVRGLGLENTGLVVHGEGGLKIGN